MNATLNVAAATKTANYFTFNHINKTIVGSEFNFKMSGNPTKPQYEALMNAMAMQPTYTLAPTASDFVKKSYKGLTFDMMMDYMDLKGTEFQKAAFQELVDQEARYPAIKSMFLDCFKANFDVEKAKQEIEIAKRNKKKKAAEENLNTIKANVRKVVKARLVKALSDAVETSVTQTSEKSTEHTVF